MTDVQAPTLTEFLLARIAEDEAAVNDRTRHLTPAGWSYLEQFGDFGDDERWMIEIPAGRVLAECDAKRRIVEMIWASPLDITTQYGRDRLYTLFHLALPYADHEDYREEWRP